MIQINPKPKMLIIMGLCAHKYLNGKPCPCNGGICRAETGSDTSVFRCDDCDHLLTAHCDYDHYPHGEGDAEPVWEQADNNESYAEGNKEDVSDVNEGLGCENHNLSTPASDVPASMGVGNPPTPTGDTAVDSPRHEEEGTGAQDARSEDDESSIDTLILTASTSPKSESKEGNVDEGPNGGEAEVLKSVDDEANMDDTTADGTIRDDALVDGIESPELNEASYNREVDQDVGYRLTLMEGQKEVGSIYPNPNPDDFHSPIQKDDRINTTVTSGGPQLPLDHPSSSSPPAGFNLAVEPPDIEHYKEVPACYSAGILPNVPNTDNAFCHPRTETIEQLSRILDEKGVVYVCGPRQSGKTTLARLLQNYYAKHNVPVVYIPKWQGQGGNTHGYLTGCMWGQGHRNATPASLLSQPVVLLVDDAHLTYRDRIFWTQIVKAQSGKRTGLRICLFASHGHPVTGANNATEGYRGQLARFETCQRVSIAQSPFSGSGHPQLYYSRREFSDVVAGLRDDLKVTQDTKMDAEDYLYSITNGHPGVTDALVKMVLEECHPVSGPVTVKLVGQILKDENKVFSALRTHPVQLSFPDREEMDDDELVKDLFRRVRHFCGMKLDTTDYAVDFCVKRGWLAGEPKNENGSGVIWVFPSKVHEKYVEHFALDKFDIADFPSDAIPNLQSLCKTVLGRFSKSKLRSFNDQEPDIFGNKRSPVYRYKLQFSQVLQDLLPYVLVKTSWADNFDSGHCDISIPEMGWGIRLVGPGSANGAHVPIPDFNDPSIKQTLVISFRMVSQAPPPPKIGMWNVVFRRDYSSMCAFEGYGTPILPWSNVQM